MFPALAGMNRSYMISFLAILNVPRTRGDEPPSTVLDMVD